MNEERWSVLEDERMWFFAQNQELPSTALCVNKNEVVERIETVEKRVLDVEGLGYQISVNLSALKRNYETEIKELKRRNAELQTMVMEVIAKDKKRQAEFEKIIEMIKEKINK